MPLDLDAIKARYAAATGGEWYEKPTTFGQAVFCRPPDDGNGYLALVEGSADQVPDQRLRHYGFPDPNQLAFVVRVGAYAGRTAEQAIANSEWIVNAHNRDVPALIAEVEALRSALHATTFPGPASDGEPPCARWAPIRQWTRDLDLFGFVADRPRAAILNLLSFLDVYATALMDVVGQHCGAPWAGDDIVSHVGLSANEDAFALLEEDGLLEPVPKGGYRLRWDRLSCYPGPAETQPVPTSAQARLDSEED